MRERKKVSSERERELVVKEREKFEEAILYGFHFLGVIFTEGKSWGFLYFEHRGLWYGSFFEGG